VVRVTLRQCTYFLAVAELGVMAQAARRLGVSEPALADAIRKLERTLGLTLFERFHARGVALTRQGADFLESARRLLEAAEQAERAAAGIARGLGGSLRVGCFRTMAPFVLPAWSMRSAPASWTSPCSTP
jgi:DNA-binding transcriptional LysR family regulator